MSDMEMFHQLKGSFRVADNPPRTPLISSSAEKLKIKGVRPSLGVVDSARLGEPDNPSGT